MPCTPKKPAAPSKRPAWFNTGTVIVDDPKYGPLLLDLQHPGLYCYKSDYQADGSAWMWLADPWHTSPGNCLAGWLFFAPSYEFWQPLAFVSTANNYLFSTWTGQAGAGRMKGQSVSATVST